MSSPRQDGPPYLVGVFVFPRSGPSVSRKKLSSSAGIEPGIDYFYETHGLAQKF
jgi:hypothetical protein